MRVVFRSNAVVVLGVAFLILVGWPRATAAQDVTGYASTVEATVYGQFGDKITTVLASTGTLSNTGDAREASQLTGSVPFVLVGQALHAAAVGTWNQQAASEAALSGLAVTVGGTTIGADFVMARVVALKDSLPLSISSFDNLSINGVPVTISGAPNQAITIPGGRVVIDEQKTSGGSTVVNALHVIVPGLADVVIASATAGVK